MESTESLWYRLPVPLSQYEINEQGVLRYADNGELVSTYTYWSMQGPNGQQISEELYGLQNERDISTNKIIDGCSSDELIDRFLKWLTYKDHPEYEISKCGLLRMTIDRTPVPMQYTAEGTGFYAIPYDEHKYPEDFELLTPLDLEVIYSK